MGQSKAAASAVGQGYLTEDQAAHYYIPDRRVDRKVI